ncbi:MAG TPA: monofunctional biosynthetic peptidoglycan transglycosylase [Thermoanaerobaculia bacterium]|nr:monofunctional biosynthetic peptidoglycan transglycosylase [Thermoanaerobaculia bacterium]
MFKRIVLIALAAIAAWLAFELITFPDVAKLAKERPETTAFMERRKDELRDNGKSDKLEWTWVAYSRISPNLRRAVLVAEDNAFYDHQGVDTKAMKEAFERNWKRGKVTHGGSTITQQLAKNLYLSPSRNPLRKVREYFIARSLEKHLSKKRILEIYLNVVEMGERVYGAEAAARHYFGKSARSLSPREAALLAGCLPNPRIMKPDAPNKRLLARQRMILSRMQRWGHIAETSVLTEKKKEEPPATETTATETTATDTTETAETTETTDTAATDTTVTNETTTDPPPAETETTLPPPTNTDTTSTGGATTPWTSM